MIHLDGQNMDPLNFKVYPDTKVFRLFHNFAKYNELDLFNLSFSLNCIPVLDYELSVEDIGCKNEDSIVVRYETHVYTKKIKL